MASVLLDTCVWGVGAIVPFIQGLESAGPNLSPAVIAHALALANESP